MLDCFSFYPTKNLGAYGDGGALTTDDPGALADLARVRNGGQRERYNHVRLGVCSRLDELQAAILRVSYLTSIAGTALAAKTLTATIA